MKNNVDRILAFSFILPTVLLMLQLILLGLGLIDSEKLKNFNIIVSGLVMFISLLLAYNRNVKILFQVYLSLLFILTLSIIFFPANLEFIKSNYFYTLFVCAPSFLSMFLIKKVDNLEFILNVSSFIILFLGLLYFYFTITGLVSISNYNMSYSYYLLLPSLFFAYRGKWHTVLAIITLVLMLALGARGPVIVSLGYFLFVNFLFIKNYLKPVVIILALFILTFFFSDKLIDIIISNFGKTSRTIQFLAEGQFTNDSNRFDKYSEVWGIIANNPFFGKGLFGDRVILNGSYSHNIILELFIDFGILGGGFLLVLLFRLFFLSYRDGDDRARKLLLLFFFFGFIPFLFSSSYLINSSFSLFLASIFMFQNNSKSKYNLN